MVAHRGQDFCSPKCADDYHNRAKKLARQAEIILADSSLVSDIEEIKPKAVSQENLSKNIEILNGLPVDPKKGLYYEMQYLHDLGYDFNSYSGIYMLHNIPEKYKCQFVQVGQYRIYRVDYTVILIAKK